MNLWRAVPNSWYTAHIEEWGSVIELQHIIIRSKMWNIIKTAWAMYFPYKWLNAEVIHQSEREAVFWSIYT